jgi:hypothetical protein
MAQFLNGNSSEDGYRLIGKARESCLSNGIGSSDDSFALEQAMLEQYMFKRRRTSLNLIPGGLPLRGNPSVVEGVLAEQPREREKVQTFVANYRAQFGYDRDRQRVLRYR